MAAVVAAVLALAPVAACGGGGRGPGRAASPNGIERQTPERALQRSVAALRGAGSVHLVERTVDGRTVDLRARGTDSAGRLAARGGTAEFVVAGATLYVKGDPDVLLRFGVDRPAAFHAGRWVRARQVPAGEVPLRMLNAQLLATRIEADDAAPRPGVAVQDVNGAPVAVVTRADGSKLYAARTGTPYPVRVLGADGTRLDILDVGAPVSVAVPAGAADPAALPPTGTIVFISDEDGTDNLWSIRPDGGGRRQVSHFTSGVITAPALSPDGRAVAFQRSEEGREDSDIWLIGTDGTGEADLARSTAKEGAPTWSADGARIVFTSDRAGGSFELYSMAGDGSDVRQLTHRARVVTNSSYSLEGGRVAFLDCRAEFTNCTVWGGRSEDTARQLSRIPADRVRPAWSPDGGMLAFSIPAGPGGQGGDVAVVNGTGAGGHRLTSDHLSTGPAWSPDGTSIVFSSVRDDAQSLYVMRADGTGVRRLTHPDKGLSDSEPTWQR